MSTQIETPKAPLYTAIARCLVAIENCRDNNNTEWLFKHQNRARALTRLHMPYGARIDMGTRIDLEWSTPDKLVFKTEFHHMNDGGSYDGWTSHKVSVRASLAFGIDVSIAGRNRNDIREYLTEVFTTALTECVNEFPEAK